MSRNSKKRRRTEALDVITHLLLLSLTVIILYPVINVVSVSMSSPEAIIRGISFFPREINFRAYEAIFKAGNVLRGFNNSVFYTVAGTAINVVCTAMAGFALSRPKLAFRKFYMIYVMIPMYFSGGLIPSYLNVINLGLYNSVWALILPAGISVWNLIIMRSFFASLPIELDESAYLDGAGDITIFTRIIVPCSKAGIATIALFYASSHWNSWFSAMIYLSDSNKYPLQLIIRRIVMEEQMLEELRAMGGTSVRPLTSESVKYATIVLAILPMLIVYPFIQKYFVKGAMIGSLKG